ncbi:MAG: hypothetical protein PHV18_15110 [Lachnospiraceae bacterium]|nr:hypothetical protein [Lachnospiraceae bacterium]
MRKTNESFINIVAIKRHRLEALEKAYRIITEMTKSETESLRYYQEELDKTIDTFRIDNPDKTEEEVEANYKYDFRNEEIEELTIKIMGYKQALDAIEKLA